MPALIVPSVFTAIDKVSSVVKTMGNNISGYFVNKADAGLKKIDNTAKKLIPGLGAASKQFLAFASTAAVTAAIIGGLNFSYDAIKEYDKSIGSLLAVTGLSKEEFKPFGEEIARVAKQTKSSSIDVAKAMETIGSANSDLLKSADAMGAVTLAAITLSQASGDELQPTAENLVGTMNQFSLGADQASRTMNVLAAGTKVGAATIPQISESMKNFGAVAAGANVSVEQSVALIEVLATKQIKGAEAGTALRGSILKLQKTGVGYKTGQFNINEALNDTVIKLNLLKTAKEKDALVTKIFGAENVTAGKILLTNTALFDDWTKQVTGTNEAVIQAAKNNDTLSKAGEQLKNKWVTLITTNTSVNGGVDKLKNSIKFLTDNLEDVIKYTVIIVGVYAGFRIAILAARAALVVYNVVYGINNALQKRSLLYTEGNIIAKNADLVTTKLVTAAQWAWNAAMTANPIGLLIAAVVILTALIVAIILKWNEWGAAMSLLLGPIGLIISLIQSFRRNWEMITTAFKEGGILAGLKAIGVTILDALIMPLEQVMAIISKITGSDWAAKATTDIAKFRKDLGVNVTTDESGDPRKDAPMVNDKVSMANAQSQMYKEFVQRQQVSVDIKTDQQNTTVKSNDTLVPVKLKSTMGVK